MKNFFHTLSTLTLCGLFFIPNAHASRARLLVFGTGDAGLFLSGGSLSDNDPYNLFYNPSYVNDHGNWGIIEKSNSPGKTAQGGFFTSLGSFSFGVFMNRGDAITGVFPNRAEMRPFEFAFGADLGMMKWGIGLEFAKFRGTATPVGTALSIPSDGSDVTIRAGFQAMDVEPFCSFKASGTDKVTLSGTPVQFKNKSFTVGTRYHWGEWTSFAAYRKDTTNDISQVTSYGGGVNRSTKLTEAVLFSSTLSFFRDSTQGRNVLPVNFAVEADATSWLVVRGGLEYHLIDKIGADYLTDNTTGRIGAGLHLGKASFDWVVGKATSSHQTSSLENPPVTNAAYPPDAQSFDIGNGFFTAASLSYRW